MIARLSAMRLSRIAVLGILCTALLALAGCDSAGPNDQDSSTQLEFETAPTDQLDQTIRDSPEDFTWDLYQNNIEILLTSGTQWSGNIQLSTFQIQNGEIVERDASDPVSNEAPHWSPVP